MTALSIHSFAHGAPHAEAVARTLGIPLIRIATHAFPDGESLVTAPGGSSTTIIYCPLDRPNARLVELMFAAEALRRGGAKRLVLVAPYLCYMRQDAAFHDGEAISQRAMGPWLASLFDRIVTVDAHLHRVDKISAVFPGIESENLTAASAIGAFVKARGLPSTTLIAGPDGESIQWVKKIEAESGFTSTVATKRRLGDRSVEVSFPDVALEGRPVLLVDDIVSSGVTMVAAIKALKQAGAGNISIAATHALFDTAAETAMREAGANDIWSTTSVPHPTNAIPLAALLADALDTEKGSRS